MKHMLVLTAAILLTSCATPHSAENSAKLAACPTHVTPSAYPRPSYPEYEAQNGYEDRCLVRFDIDSTGTPVNPDTRCTYKAFAESAEAALLEVKFDPSLSAKLPVSGQCAVYNFEYSLEPSPETP